MEVNISLSWHFCVLHWIHTELIASNENRIFFNLSIPLLSLYLRTVLVNISFSLWASKTVGFLGSFSRVSTSHLSIQFLEEIQNFSTSSVAETRPGSHCYYSIHKLVLVWCVGLLSLSAVLPVNLLCRKSGAEKTHRVFPNILIYLNQRCSKENIFTMIEGLQ